MRCFTYSLLAAGVIVGGVAESAWCAVVSLNPVADAFVDGAQPTSNFGGGGALAISAPGLAQGEFQSLLRFDTSSAFSSFNSTFGAGQWAVQSITLQLTATAPNNVIFNAQAAGQFAASWMQNNAWVEGSGTPAAPGSTGITFATLSGVLSGADAGLGTFAFGGGTSGASVYTLGLPSGLVAEVAGGGLASLRLYAADTAVSYVFNSRSFGTVASRPVLSITATAIPAPAAAWIVGLPGLGGLATGRRRRGAKA